MLQVGFVALTRPFLCITRHILISLQNLNMHAFGVKSQCEDHLSVDRLLDIDQNYTHRQPQDVSLLQESRRRGFQLFHLCR